jgi:hypothetical protein
MRKTQSMPNTLKQWLGKLIIFGSLEDFAAIVTATFSDIHAIMDFTATLITDTTATEDSTIIEQSASRLIC